MEWLGLVWDLSVDRISIPERRIVSLVNSLNLLKRKFRFVTPREVAPITGKIVSLSPGFGNIALLMSRFLQSFVKLHGCWDQLLDISSYQFFKECSLEIEFWIGNPSKLNGDLLFSIRSRLLLFIRTPVV